MSKHAAERQRIITDLQSWIRQNQALGAQWYLDEGDPPEMNSASPGAPVPVPKTAPPADKPQASQVPTSKEPTTGTAPTGKVDGGQAKDAVFQAVCDRFVADTMAVIARQEEADPRRPASDPLLEAHGGDAAAAMAALKAEVLPCTACDLSADRTTTVFGAGNPRADVVFVGEAPGRDEDLQGEPFVGASGQLLTKILAAIGFAREDVFICNILKCRPPNNRDPLPAEVQCCEPHLKRQLAILQPRVICCLGRVAAQTLLKTDLSLGKLRRTVHFYAGVPVMATFHPAALLRNPGWKRDTWDDVRKLHALSEALAAREK